MKNQKKGLIQKITNLSGTSKAGKEFTKYQLILKTEETDWQEAPVVYAFTVFKQAYEKLQMTTAQVGQELTVTFKIECREWNEKWFTDLVATDFDFLMTEPTAPTSTTTCLKNVESKAQEQAGDDLPF